MVEAVCRPGEARRSRGPDGRGMIGATSPMFGGLELNTPTAAEGPFQTILSIAIAAGLRTEAGGATPH